jgi:hypothetical protein
MNLIPIAIVLLKFLLNNLNRFEYREIHLGPHVNLRCPLCHARSLVVACFVIGAREFRGGKMADVIKLFKEGADLARLLEGGFRRSKWSCP